VASVEGHTIKSVIALGVLDTLKRAYRSVGVFRAVSPQLESRDLVLEMLLEISGSQLKLEDCVGANYRDVHASPEKALAQIIERYKKIESTVDAVVILGSDYTDVVSPAELSFNARVATNLAAPMLLVLSGRNAISGEENLGQAPEREPTEIGQVADLAMQELSEADTTLLDAVVNRAGADTN